MILKFYIVLSLSLSPISLIHMHMHMHMANWRPANLNNISFIHIQKYMRHIHIYPWIN